MSAFETRLTVLCAAVWLAFAAPARVMAQDPQVGSVSGTVADTSGGVLPGVVVSAVSASGRTVSTMVTGSEGDFSLERLPVGPIDLLFHIDGFEDAKITVTVHPTGTHASGAPKIVQQLQLKGLTESVVVRADLPVEPKPRPVLLPVAQHDPSAVCGPAKAEAVVRSPGTVVSRADATGRGLFGASDEVLIDAGANAGFRVGDNFIVRRRYATLLTDGKRGPVVGEHSAGLAQIVAVHDEVSTAVVVYSCDEVMSGDYLVRFEPEPQSAPEPMGVPVFDAAARILFPDSGQGLGIANRMLVIDRGTLGGVATGQRFTLFRRSRFSGSKPVVIGEAVVVSVRRESATIRIEYSNDVVFSGVNGDWAAPHKPRQRASQ